MWISLGITVACLTALTGFLQYLKFQREVVPRKLETEALAARLAALEALAPQFNQTAQELREVADRVSKLTLHATTVRR